jgi:hypothetical protein
MLQKDSVCEGVRTCVRQAAGLNNHVHHVANHYFFSFWAYLLRQNDRLASVSLAASPPTSTADGELMHVDAPNCQKNWQRQAAIAAKCPKSKHRYAKNLINKRICQSPNSYFPIFSRAIARYPCPLGPACGRTNSSYGN